MAAVANVPLAESLSHDFSMCRLASRSLVSSAWKVGKRPTGLGMAAGIAGLSEKTAIFSTQANL
jgi:hypothetical protein